MDPFQIRLECVALLRRLTASQQSITKVVDYAIRHATLASDDIWDCIITECSKTTLNNRLNILFLIDSLLLQIVDPIGYSSSSTGNNSSSTTLSTPSTVNLAQAAMAYLGLATRDIRRVILEGVVPLDNWDAVRLNATSTEKVLASWKRLNVFDLIILEELMEELKLRKTELSKLPSSVRVDFSKKDILRRIDEDRERHKRLRERAWILPAKSFVNSLHPAKMTSVVSRQMKPGNPTTNTTELNSIASSADPDALEVEFDSIWENLGDLDEDDLEKIGEDDAMWWGSSRFQESKRPQTHEEKQRNTTNTSSATPNKRKVDDVNSNTSYESTNSWSNKRFHQRRT